MLKTTVTGRGSYTATSTHTSPHQAQERSLSCYTSTCRVRVLMLVSLHVALLRDGSAIFENVCLHCEALGLPSQK